MAQIQERLLKFYEEEFLNYLKHKQERDDGYSEIGISPSEILRALEGATLPELKLSYNPSFLELIGGIKETDNPLVIRPADYSIDLTYTLAHEFSRELFGHPNQEDLDGFQCMVADAKEGTKRTLSGAVWYTRGTNCDIEDILFIKMLYVRPEFRHQGIARNMLDSVILSVDCSRVELEAPKRCWNFYLSQDFNIDSRFKKEGKIYAELSKKLF